MSHLARTGPRAVKPRGTKIGYKQLRSEVVDCCRHGAVVHCAHYCSVNIGYFHGGMQNWSSGRWPAAESALTRGGETPSRHEARQVDACPLLYWCPGHADVLRSRSTGDSEVRSGGCHVFGSAGTVVLRPTMGCLPWANAATAMPQRIK